MLGRTIVAIAAVAVVAWSAVLLRDARLQERGTELAQSSQRPDVLQRADRSYESAGFLNPDTAPEVGRAFALRALGRGLVAVAVLDEVVRREPENLNAWRLLSLFTIELDPARSRQAAERARALDPLGAPRQD